MSIEIKRKNYTVKLDDPVMYVDNESRHRSGHMSHAMAQWAPNKFIDFNSNVSAEKWDGHTAFGWIEYRISEDGGETYSDVYELPYSKEAFYDGVYAIGVEKAVACDDGRIVAFCLRNDSGKGCTPWDTPMVVTSLDYGKTWTKEKELCPYKGRVYDACYYEGEIYVLEFCNDATVNFVGVSEEHVYRIFKSKDNGETFEEFCVVPVPTEGRCYGSMLFDDDGKLHVYAYNVNDERHMDHIVSTDKGVTWGEAETCYLDKGIRNPQTNQMDGIYILHGRKGDNLADVERGFVLYTSEDGYNWDEGTHIGHVGGGCYYSNNLVLKDKNGNNRLLIQYSECYKGNRVNVKHTWLTIEK